MSEPVALVRRSAALFGARDFAYHQTDVSDGAARVDLLLYEGSSSRPARGLEFELRRDGAWRTERVHPIADGELPAKHEQMMAARQRRLREACFGEAFNDASVQHSFGVDRTHNLCCHLGGDAKAYADRSGNPIGRASDRIGSDSWSTCMGSNVCGFYAQSFRDGTHARFAASPDLYRLATHIPPNADCEAYVAEQLSTSPHGTPGIRTQGDAAACSAADRLAVEVLERHADVQAAIERL